ncbi:MAG: helix-turn-helix domain-containing protein [Mediterraneibacter gnavus]
MKQEDRAQVQKVLDAIIEESKRVIFPETPDERFLFGISWLFFLNEPVSIQKLAEKLYVSKTAMLQTKKQIQDTIRWYHGLFLESGKKGMWISGNERIKRHATGRNFKLSDLWLNPNGACDYFFVRQREV